MPAKELSNSRSKNVTSDIKRRIESETALKILAIDSSYDEITSCASYLLKPPPKHWIAATEIHLLAEFRYHSYTSFIVDPQINAHFSPPVGAVLRRTRPNATCIPNRTDAECVSNYRIYYDK